jgi:hypothetical protein
LCHVLCREAVFRRDGEANEEVVEFVANYSDVGINERIAVVQYQARKAMTCPRRQPSILPSPACCELLEMCYKGTNTDVGSSHYFEEHCLTV